MIRLVVGDTKPDLVFELIRDGVNGTTFTESIESVEFRLQKPSGSEVVVPLTLISAAQTKYGGNFAEGDLDESSTTTPMYGEVVVTFTDNSVQHGERPIAVYVRDEYGDF